MKKRLTIITILILAITIFGIRPTIKNHFDYVADLEHNNVVDLSRWVSNQRYLLTSLDLELASALTSANRLNLQQSFLSAHQLAEENYSLLWRGSNHNSMNQSIQRWHIPGIYRDISHYLRYLSEQDLEKPLTSNQINTLEEIRSICQILFFGFKDLDPHIQYTQTTSEGTLIQNHSWKDISNNDKILAIIDEIGSELMLKDRIGRNDPLYTQYMNNDRFSSGINASLSNSYHPTLSEEELQVLSEQLILKVDTLMVASLNPIPEQSHSNTSITSSESRMEFSDQEALYFSSQNSEKQITYSLYSSSKGGYLYSFQLHQRNTPYDHIDKAVALSKEVFKEWLKDHPMDLILIHESTGTQGNNIQFTYASIEKNVVIKPKQIALFVGLEDNGNMTIRIDAFRFYSLYLTPYDLEPVLTENQAIDQLAPQITTIGTPSLEIKLDDPKLVYRIPISGIRWVDAVYINAISGMHEGIAYDYTRPVN